MGPLQKGNILPFQHIPFEHFTIFQRICQQLHITNLTLGAVLL